MQKRCRSEESKTEVYCSWFVGLTHYLPYAICRDGSEKKMAATLKVHKWHARNVDIRLVKGFHEHYQALSWAMGPLGVLESITELPDWQVTKTGTLSIFWLLLLLLSSSVSVTVHQASMITAEAITMIQLQKNIINHLVLHSPPISRKELELVGEFQSSHVLVCLRLYAIFLNKKVTSSTGRK